VPEHGALRHARPEYRSRSHRPGPAGSEKGRASGDLGLNGDGSAHRRSPDGPGRDFVSPDAAMPPSRGAAPVGDAVRAEATGRPNGRGASAGVAAAALRLSRRRSRLADALRALPLLVLLALAAPHGAGAQPLRPTDEAAQQPEFFGFRARLQAALARHDVAALREVLHPDIKNSFGGDDGLAGFEAIWRPDDPASAVWETLAGVLALGGGFAPDGSFVAPYVFSHWPEEVDAFGHLAVVGSAVQVRAAPHADAPPLASLDYVIVEAGAAQPDDESWRAVRLPDGRAGFVDRRDLRSPIDHRAAFSRIDGRWQMTLFLAGD